MEIIDRAIILAAGEGSRLRPVTLTTPKPLVTVNGKRMIDTTVEALKRNSIHEIYIVCGYKSEMFFEAFKEDPDVTVIENTHYLEGNNITSMYAAKDFLPGSFVLEGDIIISNSDILRPEIEKSGYCANYMEEAPEWALKVKDGRIQSCEIKGDKDAYRLWGISMWTREDGERLAELVRAQIEDIKDRDVYWDELALFRFKEQFDLGIREIGENDIIEIDTFEELVEMDPSYEKYRRE
ncbi:MAG: phosphocholine cytidylyltransferase family protein [Firmicutes bacterium]|nr:phosphocholine cytidylyltransferase family protein [Bacillota bacterium]MBQ6607999.1 phosphocholine cytidylyltransferase family protein [Bacillota bacterium]